MNKNQSSLFGDGWRTLFAAGVVVDADDDRLLLAEVDEPSSSRA